MPQYFDSDPSAAHEYTVFNYSFGSGSYRFRTDSGIFSRGHIDSESSLLMSVIPPLDGSLLDLGCGYGCIGIILASMYGLELTQADVSERALETAEYNRGLNGIKGESVLTDCFDGLEGRRFDTITLNPPIHAGKTVTYRMYDQAAEHLNEGGAFYVVTMKKHGAESTLKKLCEVFGSVETLYKKSGSYVFRCKA